MTEKLLMANEAFAHAALEAGACVIAGYPGTPSSEVIETVAKLHADGTAHGIHVEWSSNEKTALEVLAGASLSGVRTLFTCKQMGLNVAADPLMCLNYVGVKGGMVLFVADDPGPISSQTEQDTRRFAAFAKVPVLDPATPEQGFAMIKAAYILSEAYGTPVIVRPTTRICHASTFFEVADETFAKEPLVGGFEKDPRWVIFPKRSWEAHGEISQRLEDIAEMFLYDVRFADFNPTVEGGTVLATAEALEARTAERVVSGADDVFAAASGDGAGSNPAHPADTDIAAGQGEDAVSRLGIVAGGVSAQYTLEALEVLRAVCASAGLPLPAYRFMQVGTPFPFPEGTALAFAEGIEEVVVFEELDHVLEDELLKLGSAHNLGWRVRGRLTGDARTRGENTVEDIAVRLARLFDERYALAGASTNLVQLVADHFTLVPPAGVGNDEAAYDGPLPVRPPVLCAGCPHRGSFFAVKQALAGAPAVFCGDIGCYTLGNAAPLDAVDTCLCMGAGITMAQGFATVGNELATTRDMAGAAAGAKCLAFVGDSTFFASALPGVANAVYNGHDVTFVVLDNSTTAMTGSQPHPGTGVTLMGERRKPIDIAAALRGLGVECVVKANPLAQSEAQQAAAKAIAFEGPSAVIFEAPCVQIVPPGAPLAIDPQECTGCKRCITALGCPAIGFAPDARGPLSKDRGQAFIDASLCNGCGLCAPLCPTSAIKEACND